LFLIFSTVGSIPSTLTALTVSFKEPREIYPMEFLCRLLWSLRWKYCLLRLLCLLYYLPYSHLHPFLSIPKSSINAPLVPEPSSRETTTISLLFSVAQPVKKSASMVTVNTILFIFFITFFSPFPPVFLQFKYYSRIVKSKGRLRLIYVKSHVTPFSQIKKPPIKKISSSTDGILLQFL